jgi:hypothetical protein
LEPAKKAGINAKIPHGATWMQMRLAFLKGLAESLRKAKTRRKIVTLLAAPRRGKFAMKTPANAKKRAEDIVNIKHAFNMPGSYHI